MFARGRESGNDFDKIKRQAHALAPGRVEIWRGPTDTPQSYPHLTETLHHDDGKFHSDVRRHCNAQGPMCSEIGGFFSYRSNQTQTFMAAPNTFKTYPRKVHRKTRRSTMLACLDGNVAHADNLFDVYLGESIAPYVTLPPLTAALPVDKLSMTLPLDHSSCPANPKNRQYQAQRMCSPDIGPTRYPDAFTLEHDGSLCGMPTKARTTKNPCIRDLNYHNILTSQLGMATQPRRSSSSYRLLCPWRAHRGIDFADDKVRFR